MTAYAELAVTTNFSFLRGASHPSDMVGEALALGHAGIGIADRNSVAGVVRAYAALNNAKDAFRETEGREANLEHFQAKWEPVRRSEMRQEDKFKLAAGARLVFADGTPEILAYPQNREGWGRLCRLLTLGNRRAKKGACVLNLSDLLASAAGLLLIVMPGRAQCPVAALLPRLEEAAPGAVWLAASMHRRGDDRRRLAQLGALANAVRIPLIAVNDVLYHSPAQRPLQDIVTCIREGVTIETAGRRLEANAERHLKSAAEMARLFRDAPHAIAETENFLARIDFSLGQLTYEYPDEPVPPGKTPQGWLEELTFRRAEWRYPDGVPQKVRATLIGELKLIAQLDYARYFLTIHDIVRFAEDRGILCQGRGSAANSAVCFVLGITSVDPSEHDLLFARFISTERKEPPDIDVDFEHERREEVIQHIYQRYGRSRAGIAATVISYRPRSAIREVGKALGLTEDVTARLAGTVWGSWGSDIASSQVREAGLDPANPVIGRAVDLAKQLLGFPRHLSQHVGGFVLTRGRLDEIVPIGNAAMEDRTFIEWDKDDIDTLGLMKVDVLALGMLTCIRKCFDLMHLHDGIDMGLADVPRGDEATYAMLRKGDSIGVFQVESRAQINMLPRLKPREFYDLVIQVAIVRPGPIQGDMVHPYLRRRNGLEQVSYPSPAPEHGPPDELEQVLGRTLGVPLFQEQAMKIAMVAARFTPEEANGLRRAMATFRHVGTIHTFEEKMVEGMVRRGYARGFAERCFAQIKGFGEYGFPESHAASFAKLVYVSSWIKCHHPAVFACGLLNAQPMGFYAPAQIVRDAKEHGVEVRGADINRSVWDNTLEAGEGGASVGATERPPIHENIFSGVVPEAPQALSGIQRPDREVKDEPLLGPGQPLRGFRDDAGQGASVHRRKDVSAVHALRLGFRQIDGFHEEWAERLVSLRNKPYASIEALWSRARLPSRAMKLLADADAFRSVGLDRRAALWAVRRLPDDDPLPLFAAADERELSQEPDAKLPSMPLAEHVVADYQTTRLSLKAHPMAFVRDVFRREGIASCAEIAAMRDGLRAKCAGIVLVRQRPGKGNAIFLTLEDETGVTNAVIWARLFERFRREVMAARLILIEGKVQRSPEDVVHLMAERIFDRSADLDRLSDSHTARTELSRADEILRPQYPRGGHHPRNARIVPKSRDFH